ncbi:globin-like protein [Rhizobium phaseoli]|nr:globin-like protein [Rhizobium phaseoli]ANL99186.1 globin-like protein [Rhizobium phaseoli]
MTVAILFHPVHEDRRTVNDSWDGSVTEKVTTLYEAIGGDPAVRALTHRFYALMDTLPEASYVRAVHPPSLQGSEEKFYEYMTGYLGGPPLYTDKRGHPRLRSRHFVAEIGPVERDEWLLCFRRALDETIASQALRDLIWAPVERLAYHMQNKAPIEEQP